MAYNQRRMRQLLLMIRMLTAVCAVCLTVLLNAQGDRPVSQQDSSLPVESAVMTPWQHRHHEATLTDATQLYRVCSSRPQRFVPTQGSGSGRTFCPCTAFVRRYIVKPLHFLHDGRIRLESAPFCTSASRDYYIIALRHIIR